MTHRRVADTQLKFDLPFAGVLGFDFMWFAIVQGKEPLPGRWSLQGNRVGDTGILA